MNVIAVGTAGRGVGAVHLEPGGDAIGFAVSTAMRSMANGRVRGIEEDHAENDGDDRNTQMENQRGAGQGAKGGGDVENYARSDVGRAVGEGGCAGRGGGGNETDPR